MGTLMTVGFFSTLGYFAYQWNGNVETMLAAKRAEISENRRIRGEKIDAYLESVRSGEAE